jgi:rhodanese-related sulfurtransferase
LHGSKPDIDDTDGEEALVNSVGGLERNIMTTTPNLAEIHGVKEETASEVNERIRGGEELVLLDCREAVEWEFCRIEGARFAPMSRFLQFVPDLDPDIPTVVYCHTGVRSVFVASHLQNQGFAEVVSMAGGIDAWSQDVDPSVPRYGSRPGGGNQFCRSR